MGTIFLNKLKELENNKLPLLSTMVIAIFIHGYKLTNTLINHDGVYNYYSNQNVTGSGRWFLSIACGISSYFDLPWINGILSIFYIALTTVIIISIFEVKNKFVMVLIGALMASFPAVTETFFFGFTADGYMLAMLMAAIAVKISLMEETKIANKIIAGALICLCCAIYQAYVSFAMVLALLYFMYELLEDRHTTKEYFYWIRTQLFIYIGGLASYYVIWKVSLAIQNIQVNDYQGIAEVGKISLSLIITGFVNTVKTLMLFVLEWNVLEHGFTLYGILNILFIVAMIIILASAIKKSGLIKKRILFLLFTLCLVALPIATCIWHFTSSSVIYRPMMLYCLCLIYIFAVILCDKYVIKRLADLFAILITVIVFNFAVQANIAYFYMEQCKEQSQAIGTEMMMRIHMIDNGKAKKIAVIGSIQDQVSLGRDEQERKIHMLGQLLERHLLYDQAHVTLFLKNAYDLDLEVVDMEQLNKLAVSQEVKEMGSWPEATSMKLSDDTIIIKLADVTVDDN